MSTESSTSMLRNKMVLKEANIANIKNVSSMLCNKMVSKEVNNSNIDNITSTEPSTSMVCNKKVLKEENNSDIGNISVIKPTKSMSCNNMVVKEATKQANMGKKLCKYCTKVCNCVNTDGKMYICSGKGIKGPPSMEGEVINKPVWAGCCKYHIYMFLLSYLYVFTVHLSL